MSNVALYDSLEALSDGIDALGGRSPEYVEKMLHAIPATACINRAPWLTRTLKGKTVLHIGCAGRLHDGLLKVCARAYGIDQDEGSYPDYVRADVDAIDFLVPVYAGVEVVLLGEILEHLTMPGLLLRKVRAAYPGVEVIITVPNAGSAALQQWLRRGVENVHREHVAWYSYTTLRALVERCGYQVQAWYWCDGQPVVAEGLLMVVC